jgi:tRNA nucleotidyltransferase/poly(A) polymerase
MTKFFQVGGSVRDELLGLKSKDIDFAVEAPSFDAMRQAIVERGGEIYLETPQYFTIRANVPGLGAADYVLCRKDGNYSDGRRPDSVEVGTLHDDLSRRDFTVNAIAKDEQGNLIDPFGGIQDLAVRNLVTVGNPKDRFTEDSLRMLRAIRFSVTKNLSISVGVWRALEDYQLVRLLDNVSSERIREELFKCFHFDTLTTLRYLTSCFPLIGNTVLDKDRFGIWLKPTTEK